VTRSAHAQSPTTYSKVKVYTRSVPGGLQQLGAWGLAVDHGDVKPGHWIVTDLSSAEIALLEQHEVQYEVSIPDVASYYVARNQPGAAREGGAERDLCNAPALVPVPSNFELGSMGGYLTWEEMQANLNAMRAAYPQLITAKESIGLTTEGRPIHFVRISNNADVDQTRPEVFYNALHHAREPASLSQLIFYMWHLLENYGTNAEVNYLLDNMELYFVPCVNPDGYVYNATTQPGGGGMWRKNRRDNGDGTFGVDLNRNYGQGWGFDDQGSSPQGDSEVYRGTAPFSEAETQVMRDFCNGREFRLALNYHTYGNLLIYPWGYQPSFYTPDSAVFANYGALLARDNGYTFGTADQTVNYVTNGGSDDWMYGEQGTKPKIFSMTPEAGEAGDGFWPPASRITDICQVNITQNLNMAHLSGRYALATDRSPSVLGMSGHIAFDLMRLGQEPGDFTVSLQLLDATGTTGNAIPFSGMALLAQVTDSIAYTLDNSVADGSLVRFVLAVDNGAYTYRDTLTKVVGTPDVLFADDGSTLANWQNSDWGLSNTIWFSPSSSITDSPFGNYDDDAVSSLTLEEALDLTQVSTARLSFMARWEIEPGYDHAQVLASADNGNSWTPLCGLWTKPGSQFQDPGRPVYDGAQFSWVLEEMDLNAYVGGTVLIRFQLVSDGFETRDGFYVDDIRLVATNADITASVDANDDMDAFIIAPNPASDHTLIRYQLPDATGIASLVVRNALGSVVQEHALSGNGSGFVLDLSAMVPGAYTCSLMSPTGTLRTARLVVVRP
jgi:hypothetical protein